MKTKVIANMVCYLLTVFAFSTVSAADFAVSPLVASIESPGQQVEFRVDNEGQESIPMEFWFEKIDALDENGKELTTRVEDEFLIFPPTAVIAPNASQTLRVQWLGEDPAKYFLIVRRAPVKLKKEESGFAVAVNFRVRLSTGEGE